ncbi:MAG: hypothetical protein RBT69_10780 [Spirochaetia bacterium]|jgi:F-type H+-transporting ATPase subunit b|nr:hypothetical protein [Spirochaetia bacterium]
MPDSLFTLIAQIVNFLIIVFVLRLVLFKKIIAAIDGRRDEIAFRNEEVKKNEEEAKKRQQELDEKHSSFGKERDKLMEKAEHEAQKEKERLLNQARKETDEKQKRWELQIAKEESAFLEELKELAVTEIIKMAKQVLSDLADKELEKQIAEKLITVIKKEDLSGIRGNSDSDKSEVVSSFPLSDELKEQFREILGKPSFKESDSFHGITIEWEGKRIRWTIESWLEEFGSELKESLNEYKERPA